MQASEQPKHQRNHHNHAQNSAQARRPVTAVGVVTTSSAKENNKYNDN